MRADAPKVNTSAIELSQTLPRIDKDQELNRIDPCQADRRNVAGIGQTTR